MNKWKASQKMICYSIEDNYHKNFYEYQEYLTL